MPSLKPIEEIGNHSYSHRHLSRLSPSTIKLEIEKTDSLIRSLEYQGPIPFRAPFGERFGLHAWILGFLHRKNWLYDIAPVPADYFRGDPEEIARNALKHVQNGSILLLHDGEGIRSEALEAAAILIPELLRRGYALVPVTELFD